MLTTVFIYSALLLLLSTRDALESDLLTLTTHLTTLRRRHADIKTSALRAHASNQMALESLKAVVDSQRAKVASGVNVNGTARQKLEAQLEELQMARKKTAILGDLIPVSVITHKHGRVTALFCWQRRGP